MDLNRRQWLAAATALPAAAQTAQDRISLAQWSFNRSFRAGVWKNLDMPKIVRERAGLDALEFVNQFFENPTLGYLRRLKHNLADAGVTPVLIMVDEEDPMAGADAAERRAAAVAHRKWVDVAHYLGCRAIRCNMRGGEADWRSDTGLVARAAESFRDLLAYARGSGLRILVENHGGASSDPDVLVRLMKEVNDPQFGLLLDLGNWNRGDDQYEAIRKTLPWARGISVKDVPGWDLEKKLRMCMESGFHGFWGIESGARPPEGATPQQIFDAELAAVLKMKATLERVVLGRG
ncbi:MAG: sugar phosphate isomerase/epimerase family protein [Bryobacteraceae bacterium]